MTKSVVISLSEFMAIFFIERRISLKIVGAKSKKMVFVKKGNEKIDSQINPIQVANIEMLSFRLISPHHYGYAPGNID